MRSVGLRVGVVALAASCAVALSIQPASAQDDPSRIFRAGMLTFGVAAGGAAFTDFQRGEVRSSGRDFDRRLSAHATVALSATLTYWLTSGVGVRAHGSFSPTRFVLNLREEDAAAMPPEEPTRLAPLRVLMADFDLLLRIPVVLDRIAPYGILGAGVVAYDADPTPSSPLPAEAALAFESGPQRRAAAVAGVGAVIPLERHDFFMTFEVTNHMTRSPIPHPSAVEDAVGVLVDPDGWGDDEDGITHTVRLMVGVTIPLAR